MKPIYTDLHIHTSQDADNLNDEYNVKMLIDKIEDYAKTKNFIISFTDHNVINKKAYLELLKNKISFIVGVELHIRNYDECPAYHCHFYFDFDEYKTEEDLSKNIDVLNFILEDLYPKKMISDTDEIPKLEDVVKKFDSYDFIVLPHGGQSHRRFNDSIKKGVKFDSVMERGIYFNQFDGFTSRSNKGLEDTEKYFKKLGIYSFTNLITCSDNYNPKVYPKAKGDGEEKYVPTWMMAQPTFQGLRLSLSERTRLFYQKEEPSFNDDYVKSCSLINDLIDIKVDFTPGLNVIIGGSSSGKTLLIDALYNKLAKVVIDENNPYYSFDTNNMKISNPVGYSPHYISQNYIISVLGDKTNSGIATIDIIRNTFKGNESLDRSIENGLLKFKDCVNKLVKDVSSIEEAKTQIALIPHFHRIISKDTLSFNHFELFIPKQELLDKIDLNDEKMNEVLEAIDCLSTLNENPFIDISSEIESIRHKLIEAQEKYKISTLTNKLLYKYKEEFDEKEREEKEEELGKKKSRETLFENIKKYILSYNDFYKQLNTIANFSVSYNTEPIESKQGHKLYIENNFKLNKSIVLDSINYLLKNTSKILDFDEIRPELLMKEHFSRKSPKVNSYDDFKKKLYERIEENNKKIYRIITKEGKNFEQLSPGWKTAIILDLVFGYDGDSAPIFIDQPEDNLANTYINGGLVDAIKKSKAKRQIIIVTHNATIPMLADAQNIIYCDNIDGIIKIRSQVLEGRFDDESAIDCVARVTDGGKAAIKKRFKKYNLKTYREDSDESDN